MEPCTIQELALEMGLIPGLTDAQGAINQRMKEKGMSESNTMRQEYRQLSAEDAEKVQSVKVMGQQFHDYVARLNGGREVAIARTKIEEAVMWAVKGITG